MNKKLKTTFIFIVGIVLVAIDQFSKNYISKNPDTFRDFSIENLLEITFTKNYGIAFNFRIPHILLFLLSTITILFLLYLLQKNYRKNNLGGVLIITVILAGAISNLIDRIYLGYVIDFINIPWFSIFNLADILIVLGVGFLLKEELLKKKIIIKSTI
ncbi:signal peptidase II [Candidatus Falkowbacteria bacterium]|jgi:signal peptidase II|nr:signal peptidase II [Candidatus Falkowbacteria bacterium]MBT4432772.1 signal peptidase II [Candidatus Falkowbacteria bacterium]